MAIKNTQRGFTTTKQVSQKRNSYFSFANERREEACLGKLTKRAEWCRRVLTHASEASAGSKANRGFTLLIAIIFMSVMLSFGLALGSLAYKQQVLASGAIESQYAFYAADAGLECALYADQQKNLFDYVSHSASLHPQLITTVTCNDSPPYATELSYSYGTTLMVKERLSLDAGKRCVDVAIYKPAQGAGITYLFSQGYDVSCGTVTRPNGARFVSRGLNAHY
jgi:hypothetical protein